jgi:hypothetical protein
MATATVARLSTTSALFGSLNVHSSFTSTLGCPWTTCDQVPGGGVLRVCGGDGNGRSSSGNSGRILGIISA